MSFPLFQIHHPFYVTVRFVVAVVVVVFWEVVADRHVRVVVVDCIEVFYRLLKHMLVEVCYALGALQNLLKAMCYC